MALLYKHAAKKGFKDFLMLSTCNRTEFYVVGTKQELQQLLSEELSVSRQDIDNYFYTLQGKNAAEHFFKVVSGLDSQIIGDYEIICQVKASLEEARKFNLVGTIIDRVANFAFQASKNVKKHTNLSSGKYSVSYAAAELLFHKSSNFQLKNILLVGTGDFGSNVARNLRHYFPDTQITLCNRTQEKAVKLAQYIKANVIPFEDFQVQLHAYDAIITTVGLEQYLIEKEHLTTGSEKLLLDLSVPQAINPEIKLLQGVSLYSVDEVSVFHNELLNQRKLEIPRAEKIIRYYVEQLMDWHRVFSRRHVIADYKEKVKDLIYDHQPSSEDLEGIFHKKKIDKAFTEVIQQIKTEGYAGCIMIQAMNKIVAAEK